VFPQVCGDGWMVMMRVYSIRGVGCIQWELINCIRFGWDVVFCKWRGWVVKKCGIKVWAKCWYSGFNFIVFGKK
jgi:hypothetical protein